MAAPETTTKPADDRLKQFRARITQSKAKRRDLLPNWQTNVQYRRGKPFAEATDQDRIAVPVDWSMTKAKQAQLFSQVPTAMLEPEDRLPQEIAAAVPKFAQRVNEHARKANIGVTMDEVTADCVNAAGIGAAIVCYESITEPRETPTEDPAMLPPVLQQALAMGAYEIPTEVVDHVVDHRFTIERISPAHLLWPIDFKHADFERAPWIGRSGTLTIPEAMRRFGKTRAELEDARGDKPESLTSICEDDKAKSDADTITFDELFYRRHLYHDDEKSFTAIHHLVFLGASEKPVVDEPWKGQKFLDGAEGGYYGYVGSCRFPIQAATLAYISDEAIPPSDSEMGRPMVDELIKSRSQMVMQRKFSLPLRWLNSDRMDPAVMDKVMAGDWQDFIPVQGQGDSIVGQIAAASFPREDFEFDRVSKQDLFEAWALGANQLGNFNSGGRTAKEAGIVQQNFNTRIGYERARIAAFFTGLIEVLAGLVVLYDADDMPELQQAGKFVFTIRPDATVLLDAQQQLEVLERFVNHNAKSGYLNIEYWMRKMAALVPGVDPDLAIQKPQPRPEPLNLTVRGAEDMRDPLVLAALLQAGQGPTPQSINAAKQLIRQALAELFDPAQQGEVGQPPQPADAMPHWQMQSRIDKRRTE